MIHSYFAQSTKGVDVNKVEKPRPNSRCLFSPPMQITVLESL